MSIKWDDMYKVSVENIIWMFDKVNKSNLPSDSWYHQPRDEKIEAGTSQVPSNLGLTPLNHKNEQCTDVWSLSWNASKFRWIDG